MHNSRFMVEVVMAAREREHAHRYRHAWKHPPEPKAGSLIRRALAAVQR